MECEECVFCSMQEIVMRTTVSFGYLCELFDIFRYFKTVFETFFKNGFETFFKTVGFQDRRRTR